MKTRFYLLFTALFLITSGVMAQEAVNTPVPSGDTPPSIKGYQVGPGDEITAKVLGEPQFDFLAIVDENGNIEVPFSDTPLPAMCKTQLELRKEVLKSLSKYLRSPQLSLQITKRNSRPAASIYGEVKSPQQVILMRKARLLELLSFSGGVTDAASGIVQIFRTQPPMCSDGDEEAWDPGTNNGLEIPNRIYSLGMLRQGDPKANPLIYPGDIVVVQKTAPVYIVGEVKSPQGIYIPEGGLKLTQAISMVGGLNTGAKSKDIKIYRRIPNSVDSQIISLNYDLIRKGEQKDVMLEPYDQIEVDKKKPSIAKVLLDNLIRAGNMIPQTLGSGIGTRILY